MDFFRKKAWTNNELKKESTRNLLLAIRSRDPIAIFGAGNLAQQIYKFLKKYVVCFIVDNPKPCDFLNHIPVLYPDETYQNFQDKLTVVVCFFTPSHSFVSKKKDLTKYGWNIISFSEVCHKYNFDYYFISDVSKFKFDKYKHLYNLLEDEHSKSLLNYYLNLKYTSNFDIEISLDMRSDLLLLQKFNLKELVYVDCGAYNGDTIRPFIYSSDILFKKIIALEPDIFNFSALSSYIESLNLNIRKSIIILNKALYLFNGQVNFLSGNSTASVVNKNSNSSVESVHLNFLTSFEEKCFIKLDIEGFEIPVLKSSQTFIEDKRPILLISVYHKPRDLIDSFEFINSLNASYKYYLRLFGCDGADLMLYCIPT